MYVLNFKTASPKFFGLWFLTKKQMSEDFHQKDDEFPRDVLIYISVSGSKRLKFAILLKKSKDCRTEIKSDCTTPSLYFLFSNPTNQF